MNNKTYEDIITEYEACGSVTQVAKKLKASEERVRRTLITEGLWTSRSAEPIVSLYHEGKTVPEIAEALTISEKTVQSYIPYSRGMYGGERSDTARRSSEYRGRMGKAVKEMVNRNNEGEGHESKMSDKAPDMGKIFEFPTEEPQKNGKEALDKHLGSIGRERKFVYRLKFSLVSGFLYGADESLDMEEDERRDFLRLAKAKEGIARTVLVPGEMSLHAMHYMILRLFGWQNEHLHRFSLPQSLFDDLTGGKIGGWLDLCGALLRFPTGDNSDLYWDDDYKPNQSVKSWLRGKYRKSYEQKAVSESLVATMDEIKDFQNHCMAPDGTRAKLTRDDTLEDLFHTVAFDENFNTILERLRICDLFVSPSEEGDISLDDWKGQALRSKDDAAADIRSLMKDRKEKAALDESVGELKSWRELRSSIDSALFYGRRAEVEKQLGKKAEEVIREAEKAIPAWEDEAFDILDMYNPKVHPAFNILYYLYDFGDDWCIKISCEKRYLRVDEWDFPNKYGFVRAETMNHKDGLRTYRYFEEDGSEITGEERDRLSEVDVKKAPLCIASDGVSLVEDAGGIYGFYNMLKTIAGDDAEEKKSMKEWARGLGWTGRISKPENML